MVGTHFTQSAWEHHSKLFPQVLPCWVQYLDPCLLACSSRSDCGSVKPDVSTPRPQTRFSHHMTALHDTVEVRGADGALFHLNRAGNNTQKHPDRPL